MFWLNDSVHILYSDHFEDIIKHAALFDAVSCYQSLAGSPRNLTRHSTEYDSNFDGTGITYKKAQLTQRERATAVHV